MLHTWKLIQSCLDINCATTTYTSKFSKSNTILLTLSDWWLGLRLVARVIKTPIRKKKKGVLLGIAKAIQICFKLHVYCKVWSFNLETC